MKIRYRLLICLFVLFQVQTVLLNGQETNLEKTDKKELKNTKAEVSVTEHTITIENKTINYTATAGTMLMRDGSDEPMALYGFTAYTKNSISDYSSRPVTFAYNGGPGSSSIWLHMGVMGPKRTVVNDPENTPAAPYELADNPYSILDVSDVVMIDPVGTGLSRPTGEYEFKDFWGLQEDIETISRFIKQYINENDRWNSPKFLLGESYGTLRNAGVVKYLQEGQGLAINGVIMVSAVFDLRSITFAPGDDISFVMFLPTYAATAWYHKKVSAGYAAMDLGSFLEKVREFASGDYANALMKGDQLTTIEKANIISMYASFTGLSEDYVERANLRVGAGEFGQELLRTDRMTVGRLDSRFIGINQDLLSQSWDYDPQSSAISPAYTATFMDYFYNTLKVNKNLTYNTSAYGLKGFNWNWSRGGRRGFPSGVNTGPDMAEALSKNPDLEILILNGYYDIATPFYGVEYSIDHLGLEPEVKKNIIMKYYEAGHMMYTHMPSLQKFKKDVAEFIQHKTTR